MFAPLLTLFYISSWRWLKKDQTTFENSKHINIMLEIIPEQSVRPHLELTLCQKVK